MLSVIISCSWYRMNMDNYHLISTPPSTSKFFEKAIGNIFLGDLFLSYLHPKQFGFRRSKSTEDILLNLYTGLYENPDAGYFCATLLIDFKKAFSSMNHNIFLDKFYQTRFRIRYLFIIKC